MEVLTNLRFSKNLGCTDLVGNKWSSDIIYKKEVIDSINYTASGKFDGESAYFNGINSILKKINGNDIVINENEDFTISFWYSYLASNNTITDKQFIINKSINNKTEKNCIYIEATPTDFKLTISDNDENKLQCKNKITNGMLSNDWNYYCITRHNGVCSVYINDVCIGTSNKIKKLDFSEECVLGTGYDKDTMFQTTLNGYIDDFVIIKEALDKVKIPSTYLINELDPSMYEDSNIWSDTEQKFSEYTAIENRIEDLRTRTKKRIQFAEEDLTPIIEKPIWYPVLENVPTWNPPDIENPYNKGEIISYGPKIYRCLQSATPSIPGKDKTWELLINNYESKVKEWIRPNNDYFYHDYVIFHDKLFISNVNYNNEIPAYWIKLTSLLNTDKEEIDENPYYSFNTYSKGDRVAYNNEYYESTVNKNRDHIPGDETYWSETSGNTKNIKDWTKPTTYSKGSIVTVNKKLYYSNTNNNRWEPSNHPTQWTLLKRWERPEYSSMYNTGDTVYYNGNLYKCLNDNAITIPTDTNDWKNLQNNEVYFKNGKYYYSRTNKVKFKLRGIFDNHFTGKEFDNRYIEKNYHDMFNDGEIGPFLLFVNNKFIPWDDITLTRSDNFITIEINKSIINTTIKDIKIIKIPFKVVYSTTGYAPDKGFLLFSFKETGELDGSIKIYCTNSRIHELMYDEESYKNFFLDVDLTTKITDKNIILFTKEGDLLDNTRDNIKYSISVGNMLNVYDTSSSGYRVYCIWDDKANTGEDNYGPLPNSDMVRELLNPENENKYDGYNLPISSEYLKKEFDDSVTNHTFKKEYETNIDESLHGIFNYNKSKYDPIYEKDRPVNIVEYSELEMNSLKRTIMIKITEDNIKDLLGNYIVLGNYKMILLDEHNKDDYMNKVVRIKLKKFKTIKLTKDNIDENVGTVFLENDSIQTIKDYNKNNFIGKTIQALQTSLFTEKSENKDTIIMSRDIYDKRDEKNDTFVILFKRGMLPEWYNTIKYTNDLFYFTNIPKGTTHYITLNNKPHEHFVVQTGDGRYITSDKTNSFEVEDGEDLSTYNFEIVADKGYTAGIFTNAGLLDQLVYGDLSINCSNAKINWYKVTIKDSKKDNQVITSTIIDNQEEYDLSKDTFVKNGITYKYQKGQKINNTNGDTVFYVPYNTLITSATTPFLGYDKGTVTPEKIYVTQDRVIKTSSSSTLHNYLLTMINNNPDIYSCFIDMHDIYDKKDYNYGISNKNYKNPVKFITHYNNTIYPQYTIIDHRYKITGFNISPANSLVKDNDEYLVRNDSTVTYDNHIEKNIFNLTVNNNYANDCTIIVTIKDSITNTIRTIKDAGTLTDVPYGSEITVVSTGNRSHYYGPVISTGMTLNNVTDIEDRTVSVTYKGKTIEGNIFITTEQPEIRKYRVDAYRSTHQIITVKYNNITKSTNSSNDVSFWVTYGTKVTASITEVDYGYIAGKLYINEKPNITSIDAMDDITIRADNVTLRKFTIKIVRTDTDHQNLVVIDTKYNRNYITTFKADYLTRLNINNNSIIGWPGSIIVDNKTVANNNNSLSTQYSLTVDKDYTITCTNATSISGSYASYSEICAFTVPPGITKLRIRWKGNHNRSYTTGVGRVNPGQTYYMRQYNRRYNHHCHENMGTFSSYQRALSVYNSDDGRDNSAAYIESPDDPTTRRWGEYNNAGGLPFFIEWGPDINNLPDRRGG